MKHLLLSQISNVSLSAISAIHVMGQLPDTGTPINLFIEKPVASTIGLQPTKKAKTFRCKSLTKMVEHSQVMGIKFAGKPDLKQILNTDFIGELGSAKDPDTLCYIGTMPATNAETSTDDLVVWAVGPQAKDIVDDFGDLADYQAMDPKMVKQFFTSLVSSTSIAKKSSEAGQFAGAA